MGTREDAIKQILDEGADMTDENINSVMKAMDSGDDDDLETAINTIRKKASSVNRKATINAINQMQKSMDNKMDQLIEVVTSRQDRAINVTVPEIKLPEIKLPDIKVPDIYVPEIKVPVAEPSPREKRSYNFSIIRDGNGNIISLKASEE